MIFLSIVNINENLKKIDEKKSCFKDTHWERAPSNKTPALTKSMNMGIWVVGT